jgi:hypothetical protein
VKWILLPPIRDTSYVTSPQEVDFGMQYETEALEVNIIVPCNTVKLFPLQGPELFPTNDVSNVWNATYNMDAGIATSYGPDD